MVTKLIRKSLTAPEKSGHHNVSGRNQEVSKVVRSARLCIACQQVSTDTETRHRQTQTDRERERRTIKMKRDRQTESRETGWHVF